MKMKNKSFIVAFCGMMSALGVVIIALGGYLAIATYAAPIFAALVIIIVTDKAGNKAGWAVWLVTSVLSMILCVDKEAAFFYIFIGYYPLIKKHFDSIKVKLLRVILKVLFFAVSIGVMYLIMIYLFRWDNVIRELEEAGIWMNVLMYIVMIGMMMCYDTLIERYRIIFKRKLKLNNK